MYCDKKITLVVVLESLFHILDILFPIPVQILVLDCLCLVKVLVGMCWDIPHYRALGWNLATFSTGCLKTLYGVQLSLEWLNTLCVGEEN